MEVTYVNSITAGDFNKLRASVGWPEITAEKAKTGIDNSAFIVAAECEGKTVGLARVVSDGGYVALIADVIVLPEYQGKGIGKTMMNMVMQYIYNSIGSGERVLVSLMAAKGKESFYKKFGFIERPNENYGAGMTLWILK